MKPEINKINQIAPDQSVACIVGKDEIPGWLKLSKTETEYALKQIRAKEEYVIINSYFKNTYIIRVHENGNNYKTWEELRKTAFNLRKTIRSKITLSWLLLHISYPKDQLKHSLEGLILSFYSFDKYKTKKEAGRRRIILQSSFCQGKQMKKYPVADKSD